MSLCTAGRVAFAELEHIAWRIFHALKVYPEDADEEMNNRYSQGLGREVVSDMKFMDEYLTDNRNSVVCH